MAKAVADSDEIRQFSKKVKKYVKDQKSLVSKLNADYAALGSTWKDLQYTKFGEALSDLKKTIEKTEPAFTDYAKKLDSKARQLDDYLKK